MRWDVAKRVKRSGKWKFSGLDNGLEMMKNKSLCAYVSKGLMVLDSEPTK